MLQAAVMRLGSIDQEVRDGYEVLKQHHKTVTIFGSARTPEDDLYYQKARELAAHLAESGFTIITGGGHGIMAAGNQGANEAGGDAIGFNITLPHEQTLNNHATESFAFSHFAPRKIVMTLFAEAYVYFPGGFGTLDELTEILTLIQTGKTAKAPIILFGSEFWRPFDNFVRTQMTQMGLISPGDENLYTITDSIHEAVELAKSNTTYCKH